MGQAELQNPDEYFGGEIIFNTLLGFKDSIPSNYSDLSTAAGRVMNSVMARPGVRTDPRPCCGCADELRAQQH